MKRTVLLVAVFVLMVTLPALVSAVSDDEAAKALFESKCSQCHSLENATDKTDTPKGWLSTVTRMREQNGCDITRQESDIIIDYLAKFYGR